MLQFICILIQVLLAYLSVCYEAKGRGEKSNEKKGCML